MATVLEDGATQSNGDDADDSGIAIIPEDVQKRISLVPSSHDEFTLATI